MVVRKHSNLIFRNVAGHLRQCRINVRHGCTLLLNNGAFRDLCSSQSLSFQVTTMPQNITNSYNDGFNHDFTDEVRQTQCPSLFLTLFRTPGGWSLLPAHRSSPPTPVAGREMACDVVPPFKGFISLYTCGIATGYMVSDIVPLASYASGRIVRMPLHLVKKG